jgi:hypothetical protein
MDENYRFDGNIPEGAKMDYGITRRVFADVVYV